ncbi:YggT family protein [Geoalkalibacter halelectricus]|uniref:YggT family protein n=1 Tax=Geoalkalibacter halelectricus TaxID=2847045 RepID=A0ABY5ZGF5_9BACT|nr:YggT family protein [Geoalkalibacter halelectricus]MDO3380169.1 YggT family protein [Geoalkalibacter halelectricus]UWZ78257.1 YggT family protein [Geoalkalibacter halelectricus]
MDFLATLLLAVVRILSLAIQIYIYVVIARAIVSWVSPDPYNPIVRFLYNVTDPPLDRIRRVLPLQFGGLDLSPIALIFGLYFISMLLNSLAYRIAFG